MISVSLTLSLSRLLIALLTTFIFSSGFTLNTHWYTRNSNFNIQSPISASNPLIRSTQLLAVTPLVANGKRYEAESGSSLMLVSYSSS